MSKCSLCGASNTNCSTCPNNPNISLNKMNFNKHINANTKLVTTLIEDFHTQNMFVFLIPPQVNQNNENNTLNKTSSSKMKENNLTNQNLLPLRINNLINQYEKIYKVPKNINNHNLELELNLLNNNSNHTPSYVKHLINKKKNTHLINKNTNLLNKTLNIYIFSPTLNSNSKKVILDEGKSKFVFFGDLFKIPNVYKIDNTAIITIGEPLIKLVKRNITFSIQSLKNVNEIKDFIKEKKISQFVSKRNIGPKLYYCDVIDTKYNSSNNQNFAQINNFPEIIQRFKTDLLNKTLINRSKKLCRNIFIEENQIGIFIMEKLSKTFRHYCHNGSGNRTNCNKDIGQNIRIKCNKVCEKIRELENCGIIHNDLHSNNIMFDKDGEPKIIDYGRSYLLPDIINHDKIIELLQNRRKNARFVNNFIDEFNGRKLSNNLVYNLSNDLDFTIFLLNDPLSFVKNQKSKKFKVVFKYIEDIEKVYQYYKIQDCTILPNTFIPYLTREEGGTFYPKCPEQEI